MSDTTIDADLGKEILAAIRDLRTDMQRRDAIDAERVVAMHGLRTQLKTEERRRRYLWGPIAVLALIAGFVGFKSYDNDQNLTQAEQNLTQAEQVSQVACIAANESRSLISEALIVLLDDAPEDVATLLIEDLEETLTPRPCP